MVSILSLGAVLGGCSDNNPFLDTGVQDAGMQDTGVEAGGSDLGVPDVVHVDVVDAASPVDAQGDVRTPDAAGDTGVDASIADVSSDGPTRDVVMPIDAGGPDVATPEGGVVDVVSPVDAPRPDAGVDTGITDTGVDAGSPYRHTIVVDGVNDFVAAEQFTTTSSAYQAYVTWDATSLYVGYSGADVAASDPNKWVMVYLDVDPGAGTGATVAQLYNTEQPQLPAGFGADYYFRWKTSNDFQDVQHWVPSGTGGAWAAIPAALNTFQSGTYVEFSLPLSLLGAPAQLGVLSYMMNETAGAEATYAGLYTGSFTDGYATMVPITHSLLADFSSPLAPNDATRER